MGKPKHQKHAKLSRSNYGNFHITEWGLLGAPCGDIQQLSAKLIANVAAHYRLAYVDADHAAGDQAAQIDVPGSQLVYTDKINFHRFDQVAKPTPFQQRSLFQNMDGVLVNGNHFLAQRQIVILHPKKRESLQRKLDRLTDVALILSTPKQLTAYDFLLEHLGDKRPPIMPLGDINGITQWLRAQLTAARPPLYGLVLAGGRSVRMGQDKGMIAYHDDVPQRDYLQQLLPKVCQEVFLSGRADQQFDADQAVIKDTFTGLGPYGAILSAFREHPEAAWLIVACDLPFITEKSLRCLVQHRQSSQLATAFHNPATGWPDPLLTIWEPRAYPTLLQFLAQGYSCPRKVLINSDTKVIPLPDSQPELLDNVNTEEERLAAVRRISAS